MEGHFSDRPDREHGNPLEPVRTRDDVDKNLANAIVADDFGEFAPPRGVNFLRFLRFSANPQM